MNDEEPDVELLYQTLNRINVVIKTYEVLFTETGFEKYRHRLFELRKFTFDLKRLIAFHGGDVRLDDEPSDQKWINRHNEIIRLVNERESQKAIKHVIKLEQEIQILFSAMALSKNAELIDLFKNHSQVRLGDFWSFLQTQI